MKHIDMEAFYPPLLKRALFVIFGVLLIVISLMTFLLMEQQKSAIIEISNTVYSETDKDLADTIKNQANILLSIENSIIHKNSYLADLVSSKNRAQLIEHLQEQYHSLNKTIDVTHFYIHDLELTNLVRLHAPERFGDQINRITAIKAKATGRSSFGMELGVLGTFTLRVVTPIIVDNTLVGYLELGTEIEDLAKNLAGMHDIEWAVLIDKTFLNQADWQQGMRVLNRAAEWFPADESVLVSSSAGFLSHNILSNFNVIQYVESEHKVHQEKSGRRIEQTKLFSEGSWSTGTIALIDVEGKEVGELVVFIDMAEHHSNIFDRSILGVLGIIFLIIALLLCLFIYLVRIDRNINSQHNALKDMALTDSLTQLPNRKLFYSFLDRPCISHI